MKIKHNCPYLKGKRHCSHKDHSENGRGYSGTAVCIYRHCNKCKLFYESLSELKKLCEKA